VIRRRLILNEMRRENIIIQVFNEKREIIELHKRMEWKKCTYKHK
jgi:hypothetical protein